MRTDRQTDVTQIISDLRNVVNTHKNMSQLHFIKTVMSVDLYKFSSAYKCNLPKVSGFTSFELLNNQEVFVVF